jgi:hypothetical protein
MDLVYGEYKFTVPVAVKYGSVKVGATGKSHAYTSTAALILLRNDTETADASVAQLKPSYGTYWTGTRSFANLAFGRTVRWVGLGANVAHYDVRTFKVTWSYYVLG